MIESSNNFSTYSSNIQTSTSSFSSPSPSNLTSSSNTTILTKEIQKSNENVSLRSSSYILDDNLRARTNSVEVAFSEASKGAGLSQVTNKALMQQSDLLTNVSDRLKYILKNETSDESRESIREDIVMLLDKFDVIAAQSNYKELYSLQKSNSDNDTSSSHSFRISEFPPIVLSSKSMQSNTEGLGLSDLKNLVQNGLTTSVANDQSKIVANSLEIIESFQSEYKKLLNSLKTSTNSLSDLHKSFERSNETTKEINFQFESLLFDRNKILEEMGAFSKIQANTLQSNVLNLLSFDNSSLNTYNNFSNADSLPKNNDEKV